MSEPESPDAPPTSSRPLFIAPRATAGNGHGYRNKPMRDPRLLDQESPETLERIRDATSTSDEPECIGPAIVDGYAEAAAFHRSLQHRKAVEQARVTRQLLTAEQRLIDAERRAREKKRNLTGEFHVMRKMLERAKKGGRKDPPAVVQRLERVEASLDGIDQAA